MSPLNNNTCNPIAPDDPEDDQKDVVVPGTQVLVDIELRCKATNRVLKSILNANKDGVQLIGYGTDAETGRVVLRFA